MDVVIERELPISEGQPVENLVELGYKSFISVSRRCADSTAAQGVALANDLQGSGHEPCGVGESLEADNGRLEDLAGL